ncbi:MAG: type IV secretion system protein [Sphingomonadales bacterium]|nr:type IV secretion system protein [Sphingomonadales bacterium]MBD3775098.1 type IV secretion system protein [Paracoccaceae bacterium]
MESCPALITGNDFLTRVLTHIDCQAQVIGSYGYQALAQPGGLASTLLTGLLTIFIALYGIRLMFGPGPGVRDVVFDTIRIGLVVTLAFSWPAYRTLVYDVVIDGPGEVATSIAGDGQGASPRALTARLQHIDNALVRLTDVGTGRVSGQLIDGQSRGSGFTGGALEDERAMGWTRLIFLARTIGVLGLLRIAGGLLLALAPLAAGLLLFEQARGLFAGWLKGLVLVMVGSLGASVTLAAELALIEPWLADVLRLRAAGYATISAPIEIFALVLAFALVQLAMVWLLAKVAFYRGWNSIPAFPDFSTIQQGFSPMLPAAAPAIDVQSGGSRAQRISDSVELLMRREEHYGFERLAIRRLDRTTNVPQTSTTALSDPQTRLGSSYRRSSLRSSRAAQLRDNQP